MRIKLTLHAVKPRNPVALVARQRQAGPHDKSLGAKRRAAKDTLQKAWRQGRWEDLDR